MTQTLRHRDDPSKASAETVAANYKHVERLYQDAKL